jgi:S1-C subfamily serine protease
VNELDLVIGAVLVTSVLGGYRLGLLTGATSWVFLIQALVLATRFMPQTVTVLGGGDPGLRLLVGALVFVGAGFAGQYAGRSMGAYFRRAFVPEGPARRVDQLAGAVAGPLGVLVALWLLVLPPLGEVAGWPSRVANHSTFAKAIEGAFPQPPDTSDALRRLAGPAGAPQVFGGLVPDIDTGPPPGDHGLSPSVVSRVAASTVRVEGVACRSERDGSGFAVGPDLVMTNAHVVAGEDRTTVTRPDGRRLSAQVVVFDPARDLALLRVPGLAQAPLNLATGKVGTTGAVFGHPEGQVRLEVSPAAIRQQVNALGKDLYLEGLTRRSVFVLAADLAPGDSGAGLVNAEGEVVGVAFAISPDRPGVAYALTSAEARQVLGLDRSRQAETGPCLD